MVTDLLACKGMLLSSARAPPEDIDRPALILIVDDERDNRELLTIVLTYEGFVLVTARGGEEALDIAATQTPDLILLDIMMPGMNGYQVAVALKSDPVTKNIPLIMLSAIDDGNSRRLAASAGASDFVAKPVERVELCARMRRLLPVGIR